MIEKPLKVGLLWHSANSGNLGVGALTIGNMALARQVAAEMDLALEFTIIGMRDHGAYYLDPGETRELVVDRRALMSPDGYWRVIGEQDCVLDIGAGDSFADIYASRRFLIIWLTKMIAIARGTPLLLSPQTIGPFTRSPHKEMASMALRGARAVVARDRMSLKAVEALAPRARLLLSADVAFALPYEDQSARRGGGKLRVGVNVSGLLFNEATRGRNKFGLEVDYADLTRRLLKELTARPDEVETHLFTHTTTQDPWDDDGGVVDRLAAEFPQAKRIPDFASPSAVKSYISGLDFVVSGRMHACIAAFSSGTPVVPIAYSRKFTGLFGLLDYDWMVPVTGMSTERALTYIHEAMARRGELVRAQTQGMSKVEALLDNYRAELRLLFADVAGRVPRSIAA